MHDEQPRDRPPNSAKWQPPPDTSGRGGGRLMPLRGAKASLDPLVAAHLLFARQGCELGRQVDTRPTVQVCRYRLICSPALAEIVGDRRPWTVLMISLLSMPWR
jgi:hypothetical protein